LRQGAILGVRDRLCRVDYIPLVETRVHGVTVESVVRYDPFETEREYFFTLRKTGLLAAHNAMFEAIMLRQYWAYPPFSPAHIHQGELMEWGPWLDTYRLYQSSFSGLDSYGLEALIKSFNLQDELDETAAEYCAGERARYHCALYDALASALLLLKLPLFSQREWTLSDAVLYSRKQTSDPRQTMLFDLD
jgi:DNA polymerase-3 subunit epsilon